MCEIVWRLRAGLPSNKWCSNEVWGGIVNVVLVVVGFVPVLGPHVPQRGIRWKGGGFPATRFGRDAAPQPDQENVGMIGTPGAFVGRIERRMRARSLFT